MMDNLELLKKIKKKLISISNLNSLNIAVLDKKNTVLLNIGCKESTIQFLKSQPKKSKKNEIIFLENEEEGIASIPICFQRKKMFNCFVTNFPKYSTLENGKKNQLDCTLNHIKDTILLHLYKNEHAKNDLSKKDSSEKKDLSQQKSDNYAETTIHNLPFKQIIENALNIQKDFLINSLNNLPNFVFIKDYNGVFVYANKSLAESYGTTVAGLIGKTDKDFNHNIKEVDELLEADRALMDFGKIKVIDEDTIASPIDKLLWYKTIKIPLQDKDGITKRVLGISFDITNAKQAIDDIRESQEKFKTLANKAPVSILYFDKEGIIQFVNDHHLNCLAQNKVDKDFFIGKKINSIEFYKSINKELEFKKVLLGENIEIKEVKLYNPFINDEVYLNIKAVPVNQNGVIIGGILISENVTDAVANKKQLMISEQRYKAITDVITDVIFSFKIKEDFTAIPEWITKGAERVTGFRSGDAELNEKWYRLVYYEDFGIVKQLIKKIINNKTSSAVFRIFTKQKEIKWLQVYTSPFFSEVENRVTYVYVAAKDISDKKKVEEVYLETQRVLLTLMSNLPGIVYRCTFDEKWKLSFLSDGFYKLLGYNPEDFLNIEIIEFLSIVYPDDRGIVSNAIQSAIENAGSWELIYRVVCKDKQLKWVWEQGQVILDEKKNQLSSLESFILDITNTKRAEDALKESEKKYRSIFMNSPFGIAQYNKELTFVDVNDKFLNIFNISRENLLLFDVKRINNEALISAVKSVFTGKNGYYEGVYEAVTNKAILHIILQCFPIYNDENEIIGGTAIVENVSKDIWAKRVQDVTYQITLAASKSNSLNEFVSKIRSILSTLLDTSNFFVAFYDKESDVISLPYFIDEKDSFQEFPAGKTMTSYVIKNNKALLANSEKISELIQQGVVEVFGTFSKIWLGVPLVYENTVIGAVVVQHYTDENAYDEKDLKILTFISEQIAQLLKRLHLAEKISLSEIKYRTLTEQLPLGVYRADKDGKFLYVNIKLAEMLQCGSIDELLGRQLSEFSVQQWSLKKYLDIYQEEGAAASLETYLKTKSGQIIWVNDTFTIVFDANNEFSYIDGVLEDITDKKRAEEHIRKLNAELEIKVIERTVRLENAMEELRFENEERKRTEEQLFIAKEETAAALKKEKELSEMKTRFMSMISHEYRTPLTVISSSTYILEKLYQGEHLKDFNNFLGKIRDSVNHMAKLLESVLVIGKSDAGMLKVNPAKIDLIKLTKEICSEIKSIDNDKHIFEFTSNVDECIAENDEMIIRHILGNLLSNAAKYSDIGTKITFEFIDSKDKVFFKVSDSGIGIAPQDQESVFDAFHRGENIGNATGTGLGLSIVNRCVDLIGGDIFLKSKVGEGTTFFVSFPKELPLKEK